jgi:hypothetical protein
MSFDRAPTHTASSGSWIKDSPRGPCRSGPHLIYSFLQSRDIPRDTRTWNRRYREHMEKIKTGSVFEIAEVVRDLLATALITRR